MAAATAAVDELTAREPALKRELAALERQSEALAMQLKLKTNEHRAVDEANADVRSAEARLRQAELALDAAELRMERMTIRSPVAGRVLALLFEPPAVGHVLVAAAQAARLPVVVALELADRPEPPDGAVGQFQELQHVGQGPDGIQIIRTGIVFATVIAIISVQLIRIQVVNQDDIVYRTALTADGTDALANPRVVLTPLETQRGEIVDRDGEIIAGTVQDGDHYYRTWPNPATAYVGGYYSPFLIASSTSNSRSLR